MPPISLDCTDWVLINLGEYQAQNNTWGKGELTDWSQCIGLALAEDGALAAQWSWEWSNSGQGVKAYPEVVYGQKPGGATTAAVLPIQIGQIGEATIAYDIAAIHSGSGNTAFDIWLTDSPNPTTFEVPPITHEIMIWLDAYGGMRAGGTWIERIEMDGVAYNVFVGENFGMGWRYIAYVRVTPQLGAATLNLSSFLAYALEKELVTSETYLASIEFGSEVVHGTGELTLKDYVVTIQPR